MVSFKYLQNCGVGFSVRMKITSKLEAAIVHKQLPKLPCQLKTKGKNLNVLKHFEYKVEVTLGD